MLGSECAGLRRSLGIEGEDAGAVAAVIAPEAVSTKHMHVAVELQGRHTRGMTVVDPRDEVFPPDLPKQPPNVHVVVDVDAEALKRVYREAVLSG